MPGICVHVLCICVSAQVSFCMDPWSAQAMGHVHSGSQCCGHWGLRRVVESTVPSTVLFSSGCSSSESVAVALLKLGEVYEGSSENESYGSLQKETNAALIGHGLTYGELRPAGVAKMLQLASAKPGEIYFDLGSGTGKTVVLAWLLGLNACGVELVKERWETSCKVQYTVHDVDTALRNHAFKPSKTMSRK